MIAFSSLDMQPQFTPWKETERTPERDGVGVGLFMVMVNQPIRTVIRTKPIKKPDIWFDLVRFGF